MAVESDDARSLLDCHFCGVGGAVRTFVSRRIDRLARLAVHHLRRMKATGIYGDDYRHRTLWDEFCHEQQDGTYEMLESAWSSTLMPLLAEILSRVPAEECILLTIAARWEKGDHDGRAEEPIEACPELVREMLEDALHGLASERDMARFDPNDY